MSISYICEKSNPLNIVAWGYVASGGLGSFDTSLYEEVDGANSLPEGYNIVQVQTTPTLIDQFETLFASLPLSTYTTANRLMLYQLKTQVEAALGYNDYAAITELITNATISPDDSTFDTVKAEMLAIIPTPVEP